ncbi:ABC transporter permease [Candidatus Peregrinibacteria bacterium]|nr:ABC transporter permease [Candidatus Peregrinibacteria bacterium]
MITKLVIKNISERKFRSFLASLSIAIGVASLIVFLGLSEGIKNASFEELEKKSPLTQITVQPKAEEAGVISFLSKSEEGKLSSKTITEILSIEGVKNIYPEIQFNNFASISVSIFGQSLITDSMIFGVPQEFITNDLADPKVWQSAKEPYPALIPRKILDLYNLTVAGPQNLPPLTEESLLGKKLTLYPNYSTFFPINADKSERISLEVVGFSDKINLVGATLPLEAVQSLNEKYANGKSQKFLELFVETHDAAKTPEVAQKIEELGYNTLYFQKNLKDVEAKFTYLQNSLGIISLIILITASIAIISTFLATVAEKTKELGLYRAVGASKTQIRHLILGEAGIIGLFGSITGALLGWLASLGIDKIGLAQLEQTTFNAKTLFAIDSQLVAYSIIFGTLLSLMAAYLPARKASNISPIKALK